MTTVEETKTKSKQQDCYLCGASGGLVLTNWSQEKYRCNSLFCKNLPVQRTPQSHEAYRISMALQDWAK